MKSWFLKGLLWSLFAYVAIPFAAWEVGRQFINPEARLVGPFLFVSPGIALWVATTFLSRMPWFREIRQNRGGEPRSAADDMEIYGSNVSSVAGLPRLDLVASARHFDHPGDAATTWEGKILIYEERWSKLDPAQREYAVARAYAQHLQDRSWGWEYYICWTTVLFVGCLASTVNLWLIIPSQSALAVGFVLQSQKIWRRAERADIVALEWTKDLAAAIRYVKVSSIKEQVWGGGQATRIQKLQDHAHKLGLASDHQ